MKQRLLALLFIVQLLPLGVWATLAVDDTFEVNGMTFKVTSIEPLEVQVGIGKSGSPAIDISTEGGVVIPATVTGTDGNSYSVTAIGFCSFRQCKNMTAITIPNSVRSIHSEAFSYSAISSITIPNSVININNDSFRYCSETLTSIVVEDGNPVYDSRNNCNAIIKTEDNTLVLGCRNTVIPNSVKTIGSFAFQNCYDLVSIDIPNSVNTIGASAFNRCTALTSITIPSSVDSIANSAFASSGLTSVVIPNTVKSIGNKVFRNTTWYKGLPDGPVYKDNVLLEFKGSNPEGIIQIQEGTRLIAGGVFQNCPNVTSVVIPNSVTCIESQTFYGCI